MLNIRKVIESDSKVIFEWRNDDLTRKMFRTSALVKWKEHSEWLASTLKNPNRCLLMCETINSKPIALIRFDIKGQSAELSINLSPSQRGKGFAPKCLSLALDYFENHYPLVSNLIAEIKTLNFSSRKLFEKVGFNLIEERGDYWHLSASINN